MSTGTGRPRGGDAPTAPATAPGGPLPVTHKEMDSARARGAATPLAAGVTWIARYQDAWWIAYEGGWLRVTDEPLRDDLDRASSRLAETASAAARLSILRQSLAIITAPGELGEQA